MVATSKQAYLVKQAIGQLRFVFSTEKDVQNDIEKAFIAELLPYFREVELDSSSIIDFMVGSVGIEVKIKGTKSGIFKQLERYAKIDSIQELILVTSKSMGIPPEINGKPIYVVNMNKAWL